MPCAPLKYDVVIVRNLSCPAVSHIFKKRKIEVRKSFITDVNIKCLELYPFSFQLYIFNFEVDPNGRNESR